MTSVLVIQETGTRTGAPARRTPCDVKAEARTVSGISLQAGTWGCQQTTPGRGVQQTPPQRQQKGPGHCQASLYKPGHGAAKKPPPGGRRAADAPHRQQKGPALTAS